MIFGLNAWQFLLWLAALEVISIAPICWIITNGIVSYFNQKEKHYAKMINAVGKTLEKIGESAKPDELKKLFDQMNKKEETADEV